MKQSKLFIPTLREMPSDAQVISHALLVRAGYVRQVSAGIYAYLPLANRVLEKLKTIMREELDAIGAVEFLAPALLTADLWRESGRYDTYGEDLYKLKNRDKSDFILGPTHEETVTALLRNEVTSYKALPLSIYQIQAKYRDEKRPRYGLLRGREFIMKDAYSFHATDASLDASYEDYKHAYERIFTRAGLDFRAIIADAGAMGGKDSQEFMAVTADRTDVSKWLVLSNSVSADEIPSGVLDDIRAELSRWLIAGEDTLVYADGGDYTANLEMARSQNPEAAASSELQPLREVATADAHTIDEVAEFLSIAAENLVKTLVYTVDGELVVVLLQGNDVLNEVKLANFLSADSVEPASEAAVFDALGAHFGSLGPVGLPDTIKIIADLRVKNLMNVGVGANKDGFHYLGANVARDFRVSQFADLRTVLEGETAPDGHGTLKFARGIEIGHIFKLGTRYSESMNATILDENGKAKPLIMGCYGIGVSRLLSAVLEQYARITVDKTPKGDYKWAWSINLPESLAPYDVHLVPVDVKSDEARALTEKTERALIAAGFAVLTDDRNERAGVKFADSDLIGLPVRVTLGKRAADGFAEVKLRKTGETKEVALSALVEFLSALEK
ncbi:MAG: proline--tRNA ligase [Streptococcaceae bacterium]|jgi:prolyl-tRNA synthetase|nr:proline--tRNA ligase [Streptococcaceae bacterium]